MPLPYVPALPLLQLGQGVARREQMDAMISEYGPARQIRAVSRALLQKIYQPTNAACVVGCFYLIRVSRAAKVKASAKEPVNTNALPIIILCSVMPMHSRMGRFVK